MEKKKKEEIYSEGMVKVFNNTEELCK